MPGGILHAKHGAPTAISVFQVVSKLQASQAGYGSSALVGATPSPGGRLGRHKALPGGILHAQHGAPSANSVFQVVSKLQASQAGFGSSALVGATPSPGGRLGRHKALPGGILHAKHGAPSANSVFQVVSRLTSQPSWIRVKCSSGGNSVTRRPFGTAQGTAWRHFAC